MSTTVDITSPRTAEELAEETSRRGWRGRWEPISRVAEPALVVIVFLCVFDYIARHDVLGQDLVPPVFDIASALWRDVFHGDVMSATWITVRSWGVAMLIVIAVSVPLGLLLGSSKFAYHASHLTVEIMRTVPSIAAIPFLVLVYGLGTKLTVVLVMLAAVWPLLLNTMSGVHDVDPVARDTARVYGLGRTRQFRQIVIPSAMPYIATGMRIAGTFGLLLAIGASLFAGGEGLGNEITEAQGTYQNDLLYSRVFIAGLLGLAIYYSLVTIERRVLAWHPSYRKPT